MTSPPLVAVAPATAPVLHDALRQAVVDGGGVVASPAEARALVWADPADAVTFPEVVASMPTLEWVQLPFAGIEPFVGHLDERYTWTCGKGVYAEPVAEHALGLVLAGLRHIGGYARASTWSAPEGTNLLGAGVTIIGAGGIAESLLRLLEPFGCAVTVVRRRDTPVPGATRTVTTAGLIDAVRGAAAVVVAAALTPDTEGIVDAAVLEAMAPHAWLVNVGRGRHVVTDDLVAALDAGSIGGAALDVTDPEPLPDGHPLWSMPTCIITPHIANTPEMGVPLIARRVRTNVARFAAGQPLVGLVDVAAGY